MAESCSISRATLHAANPRVKNCSSHCLTRALYVMGKSRQRWTFVSGQHLTYYIQSNATNTLHLSAEV